VVHAYNTGQPASIGHSPFQLMFGREPTLPVPQKQPALTLAEPNDYWFRMMRALTVYHQAARQNIKIQQQLAKARFDRN
ncbi:unnamed protein product, partial [Didymodactylos carnosus]